MKKIKYLFLSILMLLVGNKTVYAGSISIWASANSVTVGSTINISVNAKSVFGKFNIKTSDASILSGPTSGDVDDGDTATYTFTAKSPGDVTITIVPTDMADYDTEKEYTQSKSVTIKVVNKNAPNTNNNSSNNKDKKTTGDTTADVKEYDSDNTLKNLEVENYKITPNFDKDTTEYKLEVDENVEKINIKATKNSEKAEITGIGEQKLTPGENTIEVKVTAENGNEKKYKIIVTVKDQNPITVMIDNKKYTVVKKNNEILDKLESYEEEIIKIKDQDVVSYINKKTKIRLVILKNENNIPGYYIYNEHSKKYSEYKAVTIGNVTLQLLNLPEKRKHYKKYEVDIKGEKIPIYKLKEEDKVGLIYGTNIKTANTGYYVYDTVEETLNRYYDDEVKIVNNELQDFKNKAMIFMGIAAGITIITIMISIISTIKRRKKAHGYKIK